MRLARFAEKLLASIIAWPVLRLSLGRSPTRLELHRFCVAFCARPASMPALLRGLGSIQTVRNHFIDALATPDLLMPPLLFLHIEKTAGTSVITYLQNHFLPEDVDPDPFHGTPGHLLSPLPEDKRRYALIWGHHDLPSLLRCQPPQRLVLAFFRQPQQRILSLYNYWRALSDEELQRTPPHMGIIAARDRSLLDFLQSPEPEVADFIDNLYARRLTGIYLSHVRPDGECRSTLRTQALSALARLDFVGLTEDVGTSLQMLARRTGAALPTIVPHENALKLLALDTNGVFDRVRRSRPNAREREYLDRLTVIDREIYALINIRFTAQKAFL